MKTMDAPTLRIASAADVEVLASVFKECFSAPPWNEPWSIEAAVRRVALFAAAPTFRSVIATEGSRAVGMAVGQVEGWTTGNLFLVQEMCVVPDRRREGIGRRLLDRLIRQVRDTDSVGDIYLLTDSGRDAETFYLNRGFRRSSTKVVLSQSAAGYERHFGSNTSRTRDE